LFLDYSNCFKYYHLESNQYLFAIPNFPFINFFPQQFYHLINYYFDVIEAFTALMMQLTNLLKEHLNLYIPLPLDILEIFISRNYLNLPFS